MSGTSTDGVWAVGYTRPSESNDTVPLIEHWDGRRWTPVTRILEPSPVSILNAVTAVSYDDVWAVGSGIQGTAIVGWEGRRWTTVASPSNKALLNGLFGVTAVSARDIWAVGGYSFKTVNYKHTQILHWDGHQWSQVVTPNPGRTTVRSQSALPLTRRVAVGYLSNNDNNSRIHLYLRWDGTRWTRQRA